jgi:putative Ca2+/H+ antiporter (TMEM165/GDT1 family)
LNSIAHAADQLNRISDQWAVASDPGLAAFGASFSAITLAELGDKTFFMSLILALRHARRWVFLGSFAALTAVTLLSLGIGYGLRELLPEWLLPWLAAALFLGFGARLLIAAAHLKDDAAQEEADEAEQVVRAADRRQQSHRPLAVIWEAFALVFIAELGDRTQFATIFLTTAPGFTFSGLLAGTLSGHAVVTALAVGAGRWIGQQVDERLIYRLSGGLFLVFGLMALRQAMG